MGSLGLRRSISQSIIGISASCRPSINRIEFGSLTSHTFVRGKGGPKLLAQVTKVAVARGDVKTPSTIDRATEPTYGTAPSLTAPAVWRSTLANGVDVLGIEDREVPLVQFQLRLAGGHLLEDATTTGVANLLAETMTQGTATKTPEQLEKAIDMLGASINVSAGSQSFQISGSTLARNYAATMALVEEIVLEPRFDADEFELARQFLLPVVRTSTGQVALQKCSRAPIGQMAGDLLLKPCPFGKRA